MGALFLSLAGLSLADEIRSVVTEEGDYAAELIAGARQQRLWEERQWHKLLHYKKNFFGAYQSEVDDPDFFNASNGKTDPQAELEASLVRFFSVEPLSPSSLTAQCRFIARYHWLAGKLHFDPARLPPQRCEGFEQIVTTLNPVGITIIFPAAHPNSPSSMFGHTLLRLDREGQSVETRLLDFTVSYAAQVENSNSFTYILRGLTSSFQGRYNVMPYHMKLREYAQMENRDLWEYRLKVSPEQMRLILEHTYELAPTSFNYKFLSENCAYQLLALLESGLPYELTDYFPRWTLPIDTLKLLDARYGLVTETHYQPSHKTLILARRAQLNQQEDMLAQAIARNGAPALNQELAQLSHAQQAAILDLAYDYVRYEKIKKDDELRPDLSTKERAILLARSKIKLTSAAPPVAVPAIRSDQGHATARVNLSAGVLDKSGYVQVGLRPAYHDVLDPAGGYSTTSGIDFLNVEVRRYTEEQGIELSKFTLLDILSLEPRDSFFKDVSWRVRAAWEHVATAQGRTGVAEIRGGPGFSYALSHALLYTLGEVAAEYSTAYEQHRTLTGGLRIGMLSQSYGAWRWLVEGTAQRSSGHHAVTRTQARMEQSYALNKRHALRMALTYDRFDTHEAWHLGAGLNIYF